MTSKEFEQLPRAEQIRLLEEAKKAARADTRNR